MNRRQPPRLGDHTDTQDDWPRLPVRMRPDIHHGLELMKANTGRSLNALVNEACDQMISLHAAAGGAAKIARERRRLPLRSEPARAALAYLLGYLGRAAEARKMWPWAGRFHVKPGDPSHLPLVGALIAAEIDKQHPAPSGAR